VILHEKNRVYAPVVLRTVRHLSVLAPHHFPVLSHQTQIADVDLNDCALCDDAERGVHGRLWVLLDADDVEEKRTLEFRMRHVGFFETERSRTDKTFVLWRFPGEAIADVRNFCYHPFPGLGLFFPGANNFEHFGLCDGTDFGDGDVPFSGFFFPFLFYRVTQHLRA